MEATRPRTVPYLVRGGHHGALTHRGRMLPLGITPEGASQLKLQEPLLPTQHLQGLRVGVL